MAVDLRRQPVGVDDAPRFRLIYSAGVCFLVAIVAAFVVPRIAPEPHAFTRGDLVGGAATVGEPVWFDMGVASRDVTVEHVVPVVAAGSARASIDVFVCRERVDHSMLGQDKGWDVPGKVCVDWAPALGVAMQRADPAVVSHHLVMAIVPLEAGTVRVEGVRVTHSGRWRDTTERAGTDVYLRAT